MAEAAANANASETSRACGSPVRMRSVSASVPPPWVGGGGGRGRRLGGRGRRRRGRARATRGQQQQQHRRHRDHQVIARDIEGQVQVLDEPGVDRAGNDAADKSAAVHRGGEHRQPAIGRALVTLQQREQLRAEDHERQIHPDEKPEISELGQKARGAALRPQHPQRQPEREQGDDDKQRRVHPPQLLAEAPLHAQLQGDERQAEAGDDQKRDRGLAVADIAGKRAVAHDPAEPLDEPKDERRSAESAEGEARGRRQTWGQKGRRS